MYSRPLRGSHSLTTISGKVDTKIIRVIRCAAGVPPTGDMVELCYNGTPPSPCLLLRGGGQ